MRNSDKELSDLYEQLSIKDARIESLEETVELLQNGNDYSDTELGRDTYNAIVTMLCDLVRSVLSRLSDYGYELDNAKSELIDTIENLY